MQAGVLDYYGQNHAHHLGRQGVGRVKKGRCFVDVDHESEDQVDCCDVVVEEKECLQVQVGKRSWIWYHIYIVALEGDGQGVKGLRFEV